jgi:hypothetical protein
MNYLTAPLPLVRLLQYWSIGRSRMGRLLRRRDIAIGRYVKAFPVVEIESQLARCHSCTSQPLCDRALSSQAHRRSSYSFCPNTRFVDSFKRHHRAG